MKNIFLIFGLIYFLSFNLSAQSKSLTASSEPAVEIKIEKSFILGLWNFLDALAEFKNPSQSVREAYMKSKYNTSSNKADIDELKKIVQKNFTQRYLFNGFPERRDEMSWDLFMHAHYQSSQSASINEFESRMGQTMPTADLKKMITVMKKFEMIYRDLIWTPESKSLEKVIQKMSVRLKSIPFSDYLNKAKIFYRAELPKPIKLKFSVYPIPSNKGNSTATVIYDTALVQVLRDEPDLEGRLGVFFHEICHSLYESQPLSVQKEFDDYFKEENHFWSQMTYGLINEGLATAIGNGWFYEKLTKKIDPTDWYNDSEINALAKAIYPMVKDYLEKSKALDQDFIKYSIAKIKELYPQGAMTFKLRMASLFVTGSQLGDLKMTELKPTLRKKIDGLRDLSISSPADHPRTYENMEQFFGPNTALMMIFGSDKNSESFKNFSLKYPHLVKGFSMPNKSERWIWYDGSSTDRLRIFAKVNTEQDFQSLVDFLLKEDVIKRPRELLTY